MGRKKPYSGKAKKAQLKARRAKKRAEGNKSPPKDGVQEETPSIIIGQEKEGEERKEDGEKKPQAEQVDIPSRRTAGRGRQKLFYDPQKLKTVFVAPPKYVIEQRKKEAQRPFKRIQERESTNVFIKEVVDIPTRPAWTPEMTKDEVHANEERYFENYLYSIYETYGIKRLNRFEHNLEVWRQLWRVCEISDLLLVLADARYPLFHFHPSLYNHVVHTLKKRMVLVLTKIDLVSRDHVNAWKEYLTSNYPEIIITEVTSFPNFDSPTHENTELQIKMHRRKRKAKVAHGLPQILEKCRDALERDDLNLILDELVENLRKKEKQFEASKRPPEEQEVESLHLQDSDTSDGEVEIEQEGHEGKEDGEQEVRDPPQEAESSESHIKKDKSRRPYVAFGMIGHPNVGKSSLINALMGEPRVAVSANPGRTKHLQTLFLHSKVQLVDCPGLVFPAVDMPLPLQVLCGVAPIAQVSEPYSTVQYLAERIPLEEIYKLNPPYNQHKPRDEYHWSAWDICDAYAQLKQYHTKKGRLDSYRAANEILRHCFYGKIVLSFLPPLVERTDS